MVVFSTVTTAIGGGAPSFEKRDPWSKGDVEPGLQINTQAEPGLFWVFFWDLLEKEVSGRCAKARAGGHL